MSVKLVRKWVLALLAFALLFALLWSARRKLYRSARSLEAVPSDLSIVQSTLSAGIRKKPLLPVATASISKPSLLLVEELTEKCLKTTNISLAVSSRETFFSQAKSNAQYLFNEFRKTIPQASLSNYASHCWREPLSMEWDKSQYSGHVGNVSFHGISDRGLVLPYLTKVFPRRQYKSSLACLPNLFLAGFPKCGSTYLYCFIGKLISLSLLNSPVKRINVEKEPHFWVAANAGNAKHVPTVQDLGGYFLNFLPGIQLISDSEKRDVILMDSTPNHMFNWPRFRNTDNDLTNYCLISSTLPTLLPSSKYVVIMRNPISMLYSAFWFSCTMLGFKFSTSVLLKGPDLFHNRIASKLDMFNDCMRDSSIPSIANPCRLDNKDTYASCIQQRLHLLDVCTQKITFNLFSPELSRCGRSRVAMGLYYVHLRKWLSVVPHERFLFVTLEELIQNSKQVASNILTFLDLDTNVITEDTAISRVANSCRENSQSSVDYKHDSRLKMRNDTQLLLENFYHPFNLMLARLLDSDKFLWW